MNSIWYPHLVVATIIEADGKFLMIEEISEGRRVINQPAGHVEEHESLLDAALRETLEETGWQVSLHSMTGFYHYRSPHNGITYFRCNFCGNPVEQAHTKLDEGILKTHWMNYEEIKAEHHRLRSPLVLRCLDDYLQGKRLPLESVCYLGGK